VGGDRFAGNLVCLPGGHYFGRVGPGEAARVVDRHLAGTIDLDHYRGCCTDPPVVQAAEWFARRATGLVGLADLDFAHRDRLEGGVQAVRFAHPGGKLRVLLRATRNAEPRMLTCRSARPEPPLAFDLLEVAEVA
jgi:(2Fe-2S) ferredoxin